ncbi:MAG: ABC transporter permease [Proteobacteria bacterium]|nr:ABC transporter permease [Pseudomonadota bacterium]
MSAGFFRLGRFRVDLLAVLPFLLLILMWRTLPSLTGMPEYMFPTIGAVWDKAVELTANGQLQDNILDSLGRLFLAFLIGNALAVPIGIAIALNRSASDFLRPVLTFLQSIAGVAWVPLAVIWFGIGMGSVVFVIANTIFFSTLYNTVAGVESIPKVLHRAVRSHGGRGWALYSELILPGAFVNILLGLRIAMARGWHALVGAEMIAGSNGLGYMTMEAVQWYQSSTIVLGILCIGCLWLAMDQLIFRPLERRTVVRWGMVRQ